ncbi:suppressor protein SRP40 [Capsicum chacoense]
MLEPKHKIRQLQNPSASSSAAAQLLTFKPRQVVLAESSKSNLLVAMAKKKEQQNVENNNKNKCVLQECILHYLHLNGFSKTLKYFLKESQIEGNNWKSCSLSLEDLYNKYLNSGADNDTISKGDKEPAQCENGTKGHNISSNDVDSQERVSKKKKKKRIEDNNISVPDASHPENVDKSMKNGTTVQEDLADDKEDVPLKKQKEKKKKTEEKSESVDPIDTDNNDLAAETTKKDKKKKSKEESGATDSKDSKKRKRLASDENANQGVDGVGTAESKRKKTKGLEESKAVAEQGKSNALCTDNGHATSDSQEQNGEVIDEFNNSAKQKSSSKVLNGSAEPKTVNAFQRVKIDQVEFKDDRLKDNSYWAKDGADIGYGAKAQEVLGQVKGRDFRHEKTKKKRGSYRGGVIDLQSHSVKFNYSDEE